MTEQPQQTSSSHHDALPWWISLCRWLWMRPLPFLWSTLFINIAINIGSTWLITPANTNAIPATSIVGNIVGWVSARWLFACLLATISIALLLLTWLGSRWPASPASGHDQAQMSARDRDRLLRRLHLRYEQLLAQSLQGAVQIELGLAERPAAIANAIGISLRLPEQAEQALSPHTSIIDAYNQAQQELLILGEPGAGKSIQLLELASHLVEQAEQDAKQPLPVLLPLSSWAVKRPPLQAWLIEQFALLYAVPQKLSQQWIQAELILPLLDGLDEMKEIARPSCIEAINTYHHEHIGPLVVCSRTSEYDGAANQERLVLHTAVVVQPLSREAVDARLVTLGKPLTALYTMLKKNLTLATLATTPLMLQVLILTYHNLPIQELSQKEVQLREQIWADYVQRMVERKGDVDCYPLDVTRVWLSRLARQMRDHNQTVFSLEYLQPDWLSKRQKIWYGRSLGLIGGLLSGLFFVLLYGLIDGLSVELFYGLIFGLIFGLLGGLLSESLPEIEPIEVLVWSWKGLRSTLITSLILGLSVGLIFGLIFGLGFGLGFGLHVGLGCGLNFGLFHWLIFGLKNGLSGKQLIERLTFSPNEGIRRSMKNGLLVGLLSGLFFGLSVGLSVGLLLGLLLGMSVGLLVGFIFGLSVGLQHYTLRFWLWHTHLFPWKAVSFLEDAKVRILLRRVGGGYSFTHRLLLDYFANLDTTAPSPSTTAPSPSTATRPMQQPPRQKRVYYW